jgi:hypothetical protein
MGCPELFDTRRSRQVNSTLMNLLFFSFLSFYLHHGEQHMERCMQYIAYMQPEATSFQRASYVAAPKKIPTYPRSLLNIP